MLRTSAKLNYSPKALAMRSNSVAMEGPTNSSPQKL